MRYRGPYEYDKFALNILQFNNMVVDLVNQLKNDTDKNIKNYEKDLDNLINKLEKIEISLSEYKEGIF